MGLKAADVPLCCEKLSVNWSDAADVSMPPQKARSGEDGFVARAEVDGRMCSDMMPRGATIAQEAGSNGPDGCGMSGVTKPSRFFPSGSVSDNCAALKPTRL